ncbi:MAG: ABC transporter substrate-binding protein [Oscillospiraceae bacterium]|jgi:iron complex transport system substrate-binding protein|nr:ABC transporter substrate-binding protein [Oscillospiraceae bacterium]
MKKTLALLLTAAFALVLPACSGDAPAADPTPSQTVVQTSDPAPEASPDETPEATGFVTVLDTDRAEALVPVNPKTVAIYDYSILDILYNAGFENTGIERLIVPTKDTLPPDLSFYSEQGEDKVVSGGSLFYVDWDVLDLLQPELVILGGRSFGMNASGERLGSDDAAKFKTDTLGRYPGAAFVKLSVNAANARLTEDIENNASALASIFPGAAAAIEEKLAAVKAGIAEIHDKAQASGKTALFAMMVDQTTLSVFNPGSRFGMLYDDFGFTPADDGAVEWTDAHGFDVRAEYVLEKNPDVIFLLDRSATVGTGAGAENFINDPIIARTNAAQNGDIYVLTGDAWYTMTGGFSAAEAMISDLNQYIAKPE